jgi:hypothetical protein
MSFTRLEVRDFQAHGDRLVLPHGTLLGMQGMIEVSGSITLEGGFPHPDFDLTARRLELADVIASAPDAPKQATSPTGRLTLRGHISAGAPPSPGEVADPVLEGQLTIEDFKIPVKQKSRLASLVLERMPGYEAGDTPRLNLGTVNGGIRIADRQVRLRSLEMRAGGNLVVMDGTVEQGTGRLDLKMWVERVTGKQASQEADEAVASATPSPSAGPGEATSQTPATSQVSAASRPLPAMVSQVPDGTPAPHLEGRTGSAPGQPSPAGGTAAPGAASVPPPASTPAPEAATAATFRERLEAKRHELEARAAAAKRDLDAHAEAAKKDLEQKTEAAKLDLERKVEAVKTDVDAKVAAAKADFDSRVGQARENAKTRLDAVRSDVQARVAEIKARIDAKRDELLEALEERYGRPQLCITGTTTEPVIKLCRETAEGG